MKNEHEIISYVKTHPVAVLSTASQSHKPHGAAVYICALAADQFYFVTKTETQKFQNIQDNPQVALTIVDAENDSTLQAYGRAEVIKDATRIELVMSKMVKIYVHGPDWLPPITKIRAGAYQVVCVKVKEARLAHFKDFHPGDKRIFKEL